jgi:hypothetical protein
MLEDRLFFDMNGSGLPDQAMFKYDSKRLADPQEPLQPDLFKVINDYVKVNTNLKDGDLITLDEPGLSGYNICAGSTCVYTDNDGKFNLPNASGLSSVQINITDPNAGTPALAMRYINKWNGPVVIPAYEMNGVKVPEQHLNDVEEMSLQNGYTFVVGKGTNIGLVQGFLTSPFIAKDLSNIYIWGYWDDANNNITCGSPVKPNGIAISYDGKYTRDGGGDPIHPSIGVGDGHTGLDFSVPLGSYITYSGPTGNVWILDNYYGDLRFGILFKVSTENFSTGGGHLAAMLVDSTQKLYRGQIVGISGKSVDSPYHQLHFDLSRPVQNQCTQMLDPFRSIIQGLLPLDFSGSDVSYWTVDNLIIPSINK